MKFLKDDKNATEYLKKGDKFYRYRNVMCQVHIEEAEFVAFVSHKNIPIFLINDEYKEIKYFWRDYVICCDQPDGWYKDKEACFEAGKKYYIDLINTSKSPKKTQEDSCLKLKVSLLT